MHWDTEGAEGLNATAMDIFLNIIIIIYYIMKTGSSGVLVPVERDHTNTH